MLLRMEVFVREIPDKTVGFCAGVIGAMRGPAGQVNLTTLGHVTRTGQFHGNGARREAGRLRELMRAAPGLRR